mgnify:CR=1 FL=1
MNKLVSVLVITYNSEKYVIETLNSIKNQTYNNLELIISDDNSQDNTINLCEHWVNENKSFFKKINIVRSPINTGITKNINRGFSRCSGEYIKPIAGDDLLFSDCIEKSINFCLENHLEFIYGKVMPFYNKIGDADKKLKYIEEKNHQFFLLDGRKQYRELLKRFPIFTNGLFLSKKFYNMIRGFDENYEMMEDYPFLLKIVLMGMKINFLNDYTVAYRVREKNERVFFKDTKRNKVHLKNLSDFEKNEILPRLLEEKMYLTYYNVLIRRMERFFLNKDSTFLNILGKSLGYLSFEKIKGRFQKLLRGIIWTLY